MCQHENAISPKIIQQRKPRKNPPLFAADGAHPMEEDEGEVRK